jgi:hypothetical protein
VDFLLSSEEEEEWGKVVNKGLEFPNPARTREGRVRSRKLERGVCGGSLFPLPVLCYSTSALSLSAVGEETRDSSGRVGRADYFCFLELEAVER